MNIYSSRPAPYVYICVHKVTREFYIGYREHNVNLKRSSTDDLPIYKTSSKFVRPKFDQFDWYIVAEFFDGFDAYQFEQQLIFENWEDPLLINKQYRLFNGATAFKSKKGALKGRKNPAISVSNKRRTPWNKGLTKADPRVAANISPPSDERKKKFSNIMKEWHSKNDISGKNNPMFGVSRKQIVCEYCSKQISDANYSRWHGARCKLAPR